MQQLVSHIKRFTSSHDFLITPHHNSELSGEGSEKQDSYSNVTGRHLSLLLLLLLRLNVLRGQAQ